MDTSNDRSISAKIGEYVGYGIFRVGLFIATTLDLLSTDETALMTEESKVQTELAEKSAAENTLSDKVLFLFACVVKALAALVHGFSFGSLAQSGGSEVIGSVLNVSEDVAKTTAFLTGAGMSATIAAGTFFTSSPQSPPPLDAVIGPPATASPAISREVK